MLAPDVSYTYKNVHLEVKCCNRRLIFYTQPFYKIRGNHWNQSCEYYFSTCSLIVPSFATIILCCWEMTRVWNMVERCWQGKTEMLREKLILVPLCSPQILYRLACDRTWASLVRGRWVTACKWHVTIVSSCNSKELVQWVEIFDLDFVLLGLDTGRCVQTISGKTGVSVFWVGVW